MNTKDMVVTTKITRNSLRNLKAIAALKQETMLAVLERLLKTELASVLAQEQKEEEPEG